MRGVAGVWASALLIGLGAWSGQAQELSGTEGLRLLQQEALPRWREYEQHADRWVGTAIYQDEIKRADGKQRRRRSRYVVRQSAVGGVFEHYLEDYEPWEEAGRGDFAYGVNSRYAFWLEKTLSGTKGGGGWLLRMIDEGGEGKSFRGPESDFSVWKTIRWMKYRGIDVLGKTLPELLEYQPFRVVGMRRVSREGRELWVVDFECPHAVDKPPPYFVQGGTMTLDPTGYWTLMEGRFHIQDIIATGKIEIHIDYKFDNGVPIPVRYYQTGSRSNGTKFREEFTYDWSVPARSLPESEFTLSHYGLPEPVGVVWERRTPVYVWLFVAAGALLTLGIFFRWLARRLRRGHSEG